MAWVRGQFLVNCAPAALNEQLEMADSVVRSEELPIKHAAVTLRWGLGVAGEHKGVPFPCVLLIQQGLHIKVRGVSEEHHAGIHAGWESMHDQARVTFMA